MNFKDKEKNLNDSNGRILQEKNTIYVCVQQKDDKWSDGNCEQEEEI